MPDRLCPLTEAALDAPHLPAIIAKDLTLSFSELDRYASSLSLHLHKLGIRPLDRISIFHASDWRLIALFFAAWRLGAIVCPLNLRLPPAQIAASISRLSPSLHLDKFDDPSFSRARGASPPTHLALSPYPLALLLFTSGTTGTPKIAALSLSNLLANAEGAIAALDLRPKDKWLLSLPLYHVGGIGIAIRCILARAAIVFDERDPGITHLSYVPAQLYKAWPVYRNLRCLLLGGAPIAAYPESLPVYATYGLTEMGSIVAARFKPRWQYNELYLGQPLKKREIGIAPDGEILVKGECLFQGYWENGKLHAPFDSEGWFATGDIGRVSEKEGIAVIGRKDWQFISGGENIQPEEIEQELLKLPQIEEAVIIPLNDPQFGKRPGAIVKLNDPDYGLKQLQTDLSAALPKYKIPISLLKLDEFPKNGLKVDRKKIFELAIQKDFK